MKKLKVTMIVTGFPSEENPSHGVFNKRAADQIAELVDLTIIQLRIWKPGRKFISENFTSQYNHYIISAPYLPYKENKFLSLPLFFYNKIAKIKIKEVLENTNVFHSVGASFSGAIGALWAEKFNKTHVLQVIGTDINTELPQLISKKIFKRIKFQTHGVGCNSNALKIQYEKLLGKHSNIEVIYRGIDVESYNRELSSNSDTFRFLFLGGIPDYSETNFGRNLKGGITLMNAWENFIDSAKLDCSLIFAGPDSNNSEAQKWKSKLTYKDRVELKGKLTPKEVLTELKRCDVVIIPSLEEGLPNVAMEAGAAGKCVIATNVGGLPEIIKDEITGVIVSPNDPESLGKAMLDLNNQREKILNYGKNLRSAVEENFRADNFAKSYLKLYEKAINSTS